MINDIRELLLEDGSSPYADWFNDLPADVAAKIVTAKLRMQLGNLSNVEWFRGIGEYKIDFGAGWRIYLAKEQIDIDRAVSLWDAYKQRKATLLKMAKRK